MSIMSNYHITELTEPSLAGILEIYNHYVLRTTATFHAQPLSLEEMRTNVFFSQPQYQTFVISAGDTLCGYALLTQHKKREAYDRTAEVTIYLKPEFTGQKIGSLALQHLEEHARRHQLHVLVATICGENAESIGLFSKNHYTQCAHYRQVGQKFGQWLDVVAYQKIL